MTVIANNKESEQRIGSNVKLPVLLNQIAQDVRIGVAATPGVEQIKLVEGFIADLKKTVVVIRRKFFPGGEYYDTLEPLLRDSFTKQPFRARYDDVVRVNGLSEAQRNGLVVAGITRLYNDYLSTDPQDRDIPQKNWKKYVEARQKFHAYTIGERLYGTFPSWWYWKDTYTRLPGLDDGDYYSNEAIAKNGRYPAYPDKETSLTNVELQTQIARATGIFTPEETLLQFICRPGIKLLSRFRAYREPVVNGVIIGEVWEKGFSLGGMAAEYKNVPTKYPDITALVCFRNRVDDSDRYDQKLDKLITEGVLSPIITLQVPTTVFLFQE